MNERDDAAEELRPEELLAYYREVTRVLGLDRENPDPKRPNKQAGFSINWFYQRLAPRWGADVPAIVAAFLGGGAPGLLRSGEVPREGFAEALLEGAERPNEAQLSAIARALGSTVSIIQGPPGTGKTKTILNLVSCALSSGEGATVAVVATNGEAIRTIGEKIAEAAKQGEAAGRNWTRLVRAHAPLGSMGVRHEWSEEHPGEPVFSKNGRGADERPCDRPDLGTTGWEPNVRAEEFLAGHPFVTCTIHSILKCFADGERYRYDYVIMDEASQCDVALGIIAMSCAKHLVLVGDVEQLAPIHVDDLDPEVERALAESGVRRPRLPWHGLVDGEDGMSVLKAAQAAFAPLGVPSTMLVEHYRCDPMIIGFSNECIYGGRLVVRSRPSGGTPVRVRWFEGSYHEKTLPEGRARRGSKHNLKQLDVFMEEEFPKLLELVSGEDAPSVCILTPYKGQLRELRARMVEAAQELDDAISRPGEPREDDALGLADLSLTIHTSQGKEFDYVYLLPVEDLSTWEQPWSQGRRLVNVAVTRAKRELVVVTSSSLMSDRVQRALLGKERSVDPSAGARSWSEQERERGEYIRRLVDYVMDVEGPEAFSRSSLRSVFDVCPLVRRERFLAGRGGWRGRDLPSAPEVAIARALLEVDLEGRGLACAFEAPLSAIPHELAERRLADDPADGELTRERKLAFMYDYDKARDEDGARIESHLDFAIYERATGKLVLAIEVDGNSHREQEFRQGARTKVRAGEDRLAHMRRNERMKDAIARDLGGLVLVGNDREAWEVERPLRGCFTLLRLRTNGSTAWETEAVRAAARADVGALPRRAFSTIERLIDEQVARGTERAPVLELEVAGAPIAAVAELSL